MKSMASFRFAISRFLALCASVSALVVPEPTTGLFVPSWDVAIEPGQDKKIVVNGTIQQVDRYMDSLYPGWSAKLANFTSSHSAPAKRVADWRKLEKFSCYRPLHRGSTRAVMDGINYLNSISADRHPRNGPGPRSCGRGDEPKTLDSFSDIAEGARNIVNMCGASGNALSVSGQTWYRGGWSVITGKWNCDKEWKLPSTDHEDGASVSARAISEPITHRFVPTWEVAVEPGQSLYNLGDRILVNGTIQQVDAYMEAHYPGWSAKHDNLSIPIPVHTKEIPASLSELMKVKSVVCNSPGPLRQASTRAVLGAIDHLRSISMDRAPRWSPGPGTCGKISCSDKGAIFWCNDSDTLRMKDIEAMSDIVVAAEAILSHCAISGDTDTLSLMPMVSGKAILFGDYSYVVGKSGCGDKWRSDGH
ncbi:hypothetical protein E4U57_004332 [Claviceps arundinis]|uniref:Ecp2 effector protein domain-containing protein n=1 Tax=Claviceps arundinis TaxID=1623583 RepID=A0ABQ7P785_9HYPO|nr:hypothetical protein E4U57_004332 [Claviceps arundinis]